MSWRIDECPYNTVCGCPFVRSSFARAPFSYLSIYSLFSLHRPTTKRRGGSFVRRFTRSPARDCALQLRMQLQRATLCRIFQADSRPTGNVAISQSTKHNAALPKTCLIFRQERPSCSLCSFVCASICLHHRSLPLVRCSLRFRGLGFHGETNLGGFIRVMDVCKRSIESSTRIRRV